MAAFSGKSLHVDWVYSGGTVTLSGDYTQFTHTPSVALYEQTAGADDDRSFVVGEKDRTLAITARHQSSGTALLSSLVEGTEGTVYWSPEGTAAGKPKYSCPAISQGASENYPYNNVVEISVTFQGNGAKVDATH